MTERAQVLAEVRERIERHFAPLKNVLVHDAYQEFKVMKDDPNVSSQDALHKGLRVTEMLGSITAYLKVMELIQELESQ